MRPQASLNVYDLKLGHIKRFELFEGLGEQVKRQIAALVKIVRHTRGDFIYLPGDPSHSIYFLREGRIKVTGLTEDGREVLLYIIGPGEVFGEVTAVQEQPHSNSAQAIQEVLLCEMPEKDFRDLLNTYPEISLRLVNRMGLKLKRIETRVLDLVCKDVSTRVKETLFDLTEVMREDDRAAVKIGLTQQDVANLIGASRQETVKVLRELENDNILELKYRSIIVKSPRRLRANLASTASR